MNTTKKPEGKPLVWDADKEFPELCEKLRTALQDVKDPELGVSVVQLGLIRNVSILPDQATIKMILTTPYCPYGPAMMEITRSKAEEALGRPTHVDFSLEPWDFSMMEGGIPPDMGFY
jgi:metal-sulfur cluster biosynthetic enzyme